MSLPRHKSLADLGCLLGAFRDVAQGMGLEVMSLTLKPVITEPKPNQVTSHKPFPSGKTRTTLKILALIETFSDSIYHAGYTIRDIDLRHMDNAQPPTRKTWAMRVAFATENGQEFTPSPATPNSNANTFAPVTKPNR